MTEKNLRGREILVFPHCAQCGNYENLLSYFLQKFRENTVFLLLKLLNSWIDEIFFRRCVEKYNKTRSRQKISVKSTIYLVISLVKQLLSRNFCKKCESNILKWLHFVKITEIYCHKVIFHFVNTVAVQYLNVPVGQQRLVQVEACGDPDEFSWRTVQLPKVD